MTTQIAIYEHNRLVKVIEAESSTAWRASITHVKSFWHRTNIGHYKALYRPRFGRTQGREFYGNSECWATQLIKRKEK